MIISLTLSSPHLRQLLLMIQDDIRGHAKLKLPSDIMGGDIWTYYKLLKT